MKRLKKILNDDILGSIEANLQVENITFDDANQLKELTSMLYDHIYRNYGDLGGYGNMRPLLEGAMELPMDKYRIQIDELEAKNVKGEERLAVIMQESETAKDEVTKANREAEKATQEAKKANQEIEKLKEAIKQLEARK